MNKDTILQALREVMHPGKGNKNIVELNMVEDIQLEEGKVRVTLAFPRHRDPLLEYIIGSTRATIIKHSNSKIDVEVIPKVIKAEEKHNNVQDLTLDELNNVTHIIGIASGKGGVGKSTVAVNLAIAIANMGYKVGLADADVYGPSVPLMTATEGEVPGVEKEGNKEIILPIEKFGVKWMSIGYFSKQGQALIWRGPMACNALKQMILQVRWGQLDYLFIDMPPGTGDIHISLVHDIPMEGAVIVTTPGNVALTDVEKGADMFRNPNVNRRIFGLIENMAWFTPKELPDNKYYIFGKNGGVQMAQKLGIPLIGKIPIVQGIREGGDEGCPAALKEGVEYKAFKELADVLVKITQSPY